MNWPVAVQPIARKLAERLGLAPKPWKPAPAPPPGPSRQEPAATTDGAGAGAEVAPNPRRPRVRPPPSRTIPERRSLRRRGPTSRKCRPEFDEQIAEALLADDVQELELEIARARLAPIALEPGVHESRPGSRAFHQRPLRISRKGKARRPLSRTSSRRYCPPCVSPFV